MNATKAVLSLLVLWISISLNTVLAQVRFDENKKTQISSLAEEFGTHSLVVRSSEGIVYSFGDIDTISRVHSIRKAILSTLVFQHLDKIDLEANLAELGINDFPIPLTENQQKATVLHLLKSTSGISHPSVSMTEGMQRHVDKRLGGREHEPGTIWAYNNWDYNALTTIFEQETGLSVEEAFEASIATPLEISNFEVFYRLDETLSQHSKAGFRLSARDLAKFGWLMIQNGKWNEEQLLPSEWIERISTDYTRTDAPIRERYGHGYLWWIPSDDFAGDIPNGSFLATGSSGQRLLVIPALGIVIAHKVMTDIPPSERTPVTADEFESLVAAILAPPES